MTDIREKKENVKMHLKDLRQNLKKMHLEVTEELILPQPNDIKILMNKMDQLLKLIESRQNISLITLIVNKLKMKKIKQFSQILLITVFLSSCKSSMNKESPRNNFEDNIIEDTNSEKKRMEIKFSCGDNGISEYLDEGWIILKENSQEKICTWKSVPATKDCDMEKDKGCKITKPDEIGEEKTYLLEK